MDNEFLRNVDVAQVVRHLKPTDKLLCDVFENTERLISDLITIVVKEIESIDKDIAYWVRLCQGSEWEITFARWNLIIYRRLFYGIQWNHHDELPDWRNKDKVENYIITLKNIKSRVVRLLFDLYSSGEDLKKICSTVQSINIHLYPTNQKSSLKGTFYLTTEEEDGEYSGVDSGFQDDSCSSNINEPNESISRSVNLVEFSRQRLHNCNTMLYRAINGFLYGQGTVSEDVAPGAIVVSPNSPSNKRQTKSPIKNSFASQSNLRSMNEGIGTNRVTCTTNSNNAQPNYKDFVINSTNNKLYFRMLSSSSQSNTTTSNNDNDGSSAVASCPETIIDFQITIPEKSYSIKQLQEELVDQFATHPHGDGFYVELANRKLVFSHKDCEFSFVKKEDSIFDLIGINFVKIDGNFQQLQSTKLIEVRDDSSSSVEVRSRMHVISSTEIEFKSSRRLSDEFEKNKSFLDSSCVINSNNNKLYYNLNPSGYMEAMGGEHKSYVELPNKHYFTNELIEKLTELLKPMNFTLELQEEKKMLKIKNTQPFIFHSDADGAWEEIGFKSDRTIEEALLQEQGHYELRTEYVRIKKLLYNKDAESHPMDESIVPRQLRKPGLLERYWVGILICSIGFGTVWRSVLQNYTVKDMGIILKQIISSVSEGVREVTNAVKKTAVDTIRALSSVQQEMDNDKRELRESYNSLMKSKQELNVLLDNFFAANPSLNAELGQEMLKDALVPSTAVSISGVVENATVLDSVKSTASGTGIAAGAPTIASETVQKGAIATNVDAVVKFVGPYGLNQVIDSVKYVGAFLKEKEWLHLNSVGANDPATTTVEAAGAATSLSSNIADKISESIVLSSAELSSSNPDIKLDQLTKEKLKLVSKVYDIEIHSPVSNLMVGNLSQAVSIEVTSIKYKTESLILKLDEIMQKNRFYIIILSVMAPLTVVGSASMYAYRKVLEYLTPRANTSNSDSRKLHDTLIKARQSFDRSLRKMPKNEREGKKDNAMSQIDPSISAASTTQQKGDSRDAAASSSNLISSGGMSSSGGMGGSGLLTPRRLSRSQSIPDACLTVINGQNKPSDMCYRSFPLETDSLNRKYYNGLFLYYLYVLKNEALQFYVESKISSLKRTINLRTNDKNNAFFEGLMSALDFLSAVWKCVPFVGDNKLNNKYGPKDSLYIKMRRDIRELEHAFFYFQNDEPGRVDFVHNTFSRMTESYPCFSPLNFIKNDSFSLY